MFWKGVLEHWGVIEIVARDGSDLPMECAGKAQRDGALAGESKVEAWRSGIKCQSGALCHRTLHRSLALDQHGKLLAESPDQSMVCLDRENLFLFRA